MTRKLLEWLPAVLLMGIIFTLSAQQSLPTPQNETTDFFLKKSAHVAAYSLLALLLLFANRRHAHPFVVSFVLTALYAISDEWHQSLVPERTASVNDVVLDSVAAMITLLIIRWGRSIPRPLGRGGGSSR